jgi:serine/threonine protein phosphatase PrpC
VILLSTDGLHGFVSDDIITAVLRESRSPYEAAYKLVKKAYEGASDDNVSVIVAMF